VHRLIEEIAREESGYITEEQMPETPEHKLPAIKQQLRCVQPE